jgi:hypothetical protein
VPCHEAITVVLSASGAIPLPSIVKLMGCSKSLYALGAASPAWSAALQQLGVINAEPKLSKIKYDGGYERHGDDEDEVPMMTNDPRLDTFNGRDFTESTAFKLRPVHKQVAQLIQATQECVSNLHSELLPWICGTEQAYADNNLLGWSCRYSFSSAPSVTIMLSLEENHPSRYALLVHCALLRVAQDNLACEHKEYISCGPVFTGDSAEDGAFDCFGNTSSREDLTEWLFGGFDCGSHGEKVLPEAAELATETVGSDAHLKYLVLNSPHSAGLTPDRSLFGRELGSSIDLMSVVTHRTDLPGFDSPDGNGSLLCVLERHRDDPATVAAQNSADAAQMAILHAAQQSLGIDLSQPGAASMLAQYLS